VTGRYASEHARNEPERVPDWHLLEEYDPISTTAKWRDGLIRSRRPDIVPAARRQRFGEHNDALQRTAPG